MAERIVVAFIVASAEAEDPFLGHVQALRKRAEALGGTLCAFGIEGLAFDFSPEDVEEAIVLGTTGLTRSALPPARRGRASTMPPQPGAPWSVGVAYGEIERLVESGVFALPAWGPALAIALSLARSARAGEVLLSVDVPEVRRGEILTRGTRIGKSGTKKVRGVVLDTRQPWRRDAAEDVQRLHRPDSVARAGVIGELLASHAPLGLLRADPGHGGTRILEEIETKLLPGRSLFLAAGGSEPLGSLRRAFGYALLKHDAAQFRASLSVPLQGALDGLLGGSGADPRSVAALVERWVTSVPSRSGAVLIDDAEHADDPSLEAVVSATTGVPGAFRLVARIAEPGPVPGPLAGLEVGPEVRLDALTRSSAEDLAARCFDGQLSVEAAKRWARRGKYLPLGIVEALAEGIAGGEIAWVGESAEPRHRAAGLRLTLDPEEWVTRRASHLRVEQLDVLRAAALLGVQVEAPLLLELATGVVGSTLAVDADVRALVTAGFLRVLAPGLYGLPSRTHREAIAKGIPATLASMWHRAACDVLERKGGVLARAKAARHAALAGEHERAMRLATDAAQACHAVGLEAAEHSLRRFAESLRASLPPPAATSLSPRAAARAPAPPVEEISEPPPSTVPPAEPDTLVDAVPAPDSWVTGLRGTEGQAAPLRLEALAAIARGATGEALQALVDAVTAARDSGPAVLSRALLAHAIGLAAAGRRRDALYEALEALSFARVAEEKRGEKACARLLARLTESAGYAEAARKWSALAGA